MNEIGQLDDLKVNHLTRRLRRLRSIWLTLSTNFHPGLQRGGSIGRDSDNKAETKAFASLSSFIEKLAVMLDVAMLPPFLQRHNYTKIFREVVAATA